MDSVMELREICPDEGDVMNGDALLSLKRGKIDVSKVPELFEYMDHPFAYILWKKDTCVLVGTLKSEGAKRTYDAFMQSLRRVEGSDKKVTGASIIKLPQEITEKKRRDLHKKLLTLITKRKANK